MEGAGSVSEQEEGEVHGEGGLDQRVSLEGDHLGDCESTSIKISDLEGQIRVRVAGDHHLQGFVDGACVLHIVCIIPSILQSEDLRGGVLSVVQDSVLRCSKDAESKEQAETNKLHEYNNISECGNKPKMHFKICLIPSIRNTTIYYLTDQSLSSSPQVLELWLPSFQLHIQAQNILQALAELPQLLPVDS